MSQKTIDIHAHVIAEETMGLMQKEALPGDRRAQCRAERTRAGVPLAQLLLDQLDRLAKELRLEPLRAREGPGLTG
jgi:LDH2 family malate/lactate/ureidoglycolate dehydrogenase